MTIFTSCTREIAPAPHIFSFFQNYPLTQHLQASSEMACLDTYNSEQKGHYHHHCGPMSPRISLSNDFVDIQQTMKQESKCQQIKHLRTSGATFSKSDYIRTLMNDMEEKPEEVREFEGTSREVDRYIAKMDDRARQEEELFTRVALTKQERKREKYLKKSRNGLQGLTESFYDEIKTLPFEDKIGEQVMGSSNGSIRNNRLKKRKRKH